MHPWPFVKKNKSLVLFHAISFTSKLNCSSARILYVRVSINVIKSSLLPTAIVFPSGDHVMLIFSPFVFTTVEHLPARTSQMRTVLSPLAVLNKSGSVACQHNWSTEPVCPLCVVSFVCNINKSDWFVSTQQRNRGMSCQTYQAVSIQWKYCNRFVERSRRQTPAIAIPSNRMNLRTQNWNTNGKNICLSESYTKSEPNLKKENSNWYLRCVRFLLFGFIVTAEEFLQLFGSLIFYHFHGQSSTVVFGTKFQLKQKRLRQIKKKMPHT